MTDLEQTLPAHATLIIITGMSGAGKTIAVQSLEDLGFFCVDNLPPVLIPKFAELIEQSKGKIAKVALVIDLRGGNSSPPCRSLWPTSRTSQRSGVRSFSWTPQIQCLYSVTRRAGGIIRLLRRACRWTASAWSARCWRS